MIKIADRLTPKQVLFCSEYLIDLNGTQAAIRAGYSEKTAQEIASQNLSKLIIKNRIQDKLNKRAERLSIDADWVLSNIKELIERCLQQDPVLDSEGKETGEWKFDSSGANRALDTLAKHLNLFSDNNKDSASHLHFSNINIKSLKDKKSTEDLIFASLGRK